MLELFLRYEFLHFALLACVLASISSGIAGSFVVVKRMSILSGGLAHSVFGGMGIAYVLGASPLLGAWISAVVNALLIAWCRSSRWRQQEDVLIALLWSLGMAIGVICLSRYGGNNIDLFSYLFGNILLLRNIDLLLLLLLDVVLVTVILVFWRDLESTIFDEEYARLRGIASGWIQCLLLLLLALVIVSLLRIAGLLLVICLISVPAASAAFFSRSLKQMVLLSCVFCLLVSCGGLTLSVQVDLPAAAVMTCVACVLYVISFCIYRWHAPLLRLIMQPKK